MARDSGEPPRLPKKKIGHHVRARFPGKSEKTVFLCENEARVWADRKQNKLLVLQDLKLGPRRELRLGYYIRGKTGKMTGKWVWGQYCPMLTEAALRRLLSKARQRGMISRQGL